MVESSRESLEREPFSERCVHHWVLESPSGPISQGACKKCGQIREFPNILVPKGGTWWGSTTELFPFEKPNRLEIASLIKDTELHNNVNDVIT